MEPYRTASGRPFDDRDYAGTNRFPPLDPDDVVPVHAGAGAWASRTSRCPPGSTTSRCTTTAANTTFTGEDSDYGDFFGLDDLFTENPRVVDGMIDIYKTWIRDFGIDGFRIDTMKHVNDEFWQKFGPEVLRLRPESGQARVLHVRRGVRHTKSFTSQYTTQNRMQAVLDFPFQDAARNFASKSQPANQLGSFFRDDDWYTDADSNVYQLPTFLGNHDMGRIGCFVGADNPGAVEAEMIDRDRLAHELMYFSRGNPVIYYGDEQGFTGTGGDQVARQTMFASQVPEYLDDDLLGTAATHAQDNFDASHPLYQQIRELARLAKQHPPCATAHISTGTAATRPASTPSLGSCASKQYEYVVALNNSEPAKYRRHSHLRGQRSLHQGVRLRANRLHSNASRRLSVDVPALSTVVYKSARRIPRATAAPAISLNTPQGPAEVNSRMQVSANVGGPPSTR